jgi:hypothetical protein
MYQDKEKIFWEPLRWIERVQALPLIQLKTSIKSTGSALPSATPLNPSQMLQHNLDLATPTPDAAPSIRVASGAGAHLTLFIS